MPFHQMQDKKECLQRMVEYLDNITLQLVNAFHNESNKIRYPYNSVFGKKWVTILLKNISTAYKISIN